MSERRKSNRHNNASNVADKEKLTAALRKRAATAKGAAAQTHVTVSTLLASAALTSYNLYVDLSPLGDPASAGEPSTNKARKSSRKRAANSKYADGDAPEPMDQGEDDEAEDEAGPSGRAAKRTLKWEARGQAMIDKLEPLIDQHITLPGSIQEGLMHLVLNADAHQTNLSLRAYRLLVQLMEMHPPATIGESGQLHINADLWEPISQYVWSH